MKKCLLGLFWAVVSLSSAQELKKFEVKADEWPEGAPPAEVFIVDGRVEVTAKDGNKALVIHPGTELVDASAQLAVSAAGSASIEARVFASKRGRSAPRFGISVHGMSGWRLYVTPAKKQLELVKADQIVASVPFTWKSEAWLNLKLEAQKGEGDAWSITGTAWAEGEAVPPAPQLKQEDKGLKGQGKCAVWGTPFSGTPIYFDDIRIAVQAAE